jgi:hypothetical protein
MISQHFVYVCIDRKVNRTYGGSTYKMDIYENKGKGKLKRVASCSACTRAHMGEDSEVFTALIGAGAIRPAVLKQLPDGHQGYYHCGYIANGLLIQSMGGA